MLRTLPSFVDAKRAMNINIVLGSCGKGVDPATVCRALLNVDYGLITESLVDSLLKYAPTPEELSGAERHREYGGRLRVAESFFVNILAVIGGADYEHLLLALKFKFSFREWMDKLSEV